MLQHKNKQILSELKNYFSSKEKAIQTLLTELCALKLTNKKFQYFDKNNSQYSGFQKFILLILFPLFEIKDISHYKESSLYQLFTCGKDVFYRFINNPNFQWRKFAYQINFRLIKGIKKSTENKECQAVKCLIADDTDLPKRGKCFELLSRIYSHVTNSFNYGFKGLFIGYHDGTNFFGLDFSLHGEKGNERSPNHKPYGLTKKQTKARYCKQRANTSSSKERENEYFKTKIETLILMLRRAISQNIRFDYLLVDSWFCNFELVKFIATRRIKCHILGMIKNGNTQYLYKGKLLNFNKLIRYLHRSNQKMKYHKNLNSYAYEVVVDFKGVPVKLFFCRIGKRGKWHALLSTNLQLVFAKAFEIYAIRWTIEVFFKECKQYLRLGKCEVRDFDGQIAATTLCMLQYNLFSVVKRFESYESFGALFRQAKTETLELNIKEHIFLIIKEIMTTLAEYFDFEPDILIKHIIADNEHITKILNLKNFV
jgi:hypothetical protein